MKIHANARTTIRTRALLVKQVLEQGKTKAETARARQNAYFRPQPIAR